jgi:trans-aconitate 2-methyltransferase
MWDPQTYGRYADERARPFFELIARITADSPDYVVDAGCGSGELTAALVRRWPSATVHGIDSSSAMITEARRHTSDRLHFTMSDVAMWHPDRPIDVLVSNAVLQWVPTHRELLTRWVDQLADGGRLAFQVPGNFGAPSHELVRELCRTTWRDKLGDLDRPRPVADPVDYLDQLSEQGCQVDAWETTYLHVLQGDDPVLNWISGTALRPILDRLKGGEQTRFKAELGGLLREAYPRKEYGTVFPFRRIFVVAQK